MTTKQKIGLVVIALMFALAFVGGAFLQNKIAPCPVGEFCPA